MTQRCSKREAASGENKLISRGETTGLLNCARELSLRCVQQRALLKHVSVVAVNLFELEPLVSVQQIRGVRLAVQFETPLRVRGPLSNPIPSVQVRKGLRIFP